MGDGRDYTAGTGGRTRGQNGLESGNQLKKVSVF